MDIVQFRADFPEFSDLLKYPDTLIAFWSNLGEKLTSESRLGNCYTQAVQLFTAHNLVIAFGNVKSSTAGGLPGGSSGATQSKSVGSASISYDNASSIEPGAGHWNQTSYGRMYINLIRLVVHGCVQL